LVQDFNPRSPCGERRGQYGNRGKGENISIHAPHAGSGVFCKTARFSDTDFNPRSPCGERPMEKTNQTTICAISIHAPHAGSGMSLNVLSHRSASYFNPRSPCGERPSNWRSTTGSTEFQSTLPMRGAACIIPSAYIHHIISIHAPHAGSGLSDTVKGYYGLISIHAPHAGSGVQVLFSGCRSEISIHAPHAGSGVQHHQRGTV